MRLTTLLITCFFTLSVNAQFDSVFIRKVYNEALTNGHAYARLGELCKTIGHRLSGSDNAEKAVIWGKKMLESYQFDSVFTQSVMVPRWERSTTEELWLTSDYLNNKLKTARTADYNCEAFTEQSLKPAKKHRLQAVTLGGSIGTKGEISAGLVVVSSDAEMQQLGKSGQLKGKMVLLNRAFPEENISTFSSYGACVSQRVWGASQAAAYGAVAVLVRSMSNKCDLHAHTGVMMYVDSVTKIPAMAVATAVANMLAEMAKDNADINLSMNLGCRQLAERESANIVAQTNGNKFPERIIVFGGHYDSWDQGEGAHDDGAGCMHAFEALRLLKALGYQPRHTLRCVWWMNEENGLKGATEYARLAKMNNEVHVAAIESDRGGFTPRGFTVDSSFLVKIRKYKPLLEHFQAGELFQGGGGADIGPLRKVNPNTILVGFVPDSQRYFDVHHAETDVFESVNKRELHLGAAAMAMMIVLLDQELE
jgi:hypothetical protein